MIYAFYRLWNDLYYDWNENIECEFLLRRLVFNHYREFNDYNKCLSNSFIWDVVFIGNNLMGYARNHTPHIVCGKKFKRDAYMDYNSDMKKQYKKCIDKYLYRRSEYILSKFAGEINENFKTSEDLVEDFSKRILYLQDIKKKFSI